MADPYKDKVVLFLPMEGSHNGSTVFNDLTGKVVTRYDNTILSTGVTPPWGKTSAYFDGTSDYLEVNHPDLALGTADFTIEFWTYSLDLNANRGWFAFESSTSWPLNAGLQLGHHTSAGNVYNLFYGASTNTTFERALTTTWSHIAMVRCNGILTIFTDGVFLGSVTDTYNYTDTYLKIGGYHTTEYLWYGYMKDFRVTKGVARYTGNFSPKQVTSVPDPDWGKVVLNITGEESGSTFTDISNVGQTITGNGSIAHSSSSSPPFGTNAIEFTAANSQYLSFTGTSNFEFLTNPFTIEMWIKNKNQQDGCALYSDIFPSSIFLALGFANDDGAANGPYLWFGLYNGSWTGKRSTFRPIPNVWHHVALTRLGNKFSLYVNGVFITSLTSTQSISYAAETYYIGRRWDSATGVFYYNGYIKDIRITKGVARYYHERGYETHHKLFGQHTDPNYDKLILSLSGKDLNNQVPFPHSYQNVNSVSVSSTVGSPYSATGNALSFSRASNKYLYFDVNPSVWNFGTNDFTLETWVYITSTPSNWYCVFQGAGGYAVCGFALHYGASGLLIQMSSNGSTNDIYDGYPGIPVNLNQWDHIALVRSGSNIYLYHNGTRYSVTTTTSALYYNSANYAQIGGRTVGSSFAFDGYMAGYRIYNGIAKYTAATEIIDKQLYDYIPGTPKRSPNKTDIKTIVKPLDWDEPEQLRIVV